MRILNSFYFHLKQSIYIFSLFLSVHTISHAETSCTVPVCDIPSQIEQLKNSPQAQRYKFVNDLRNNLKTITDIPGIENLRDFGVAAKKLFSDLKEEDWLIREAAILTDESALKIITTKRPTADEMIYNFQFTYSENTRYAILNFWFQSVSSIEVPIELRELLRFSEWAETETARLKDSDYVTREAGNLRRRTTERYMTVLPSHEGVFEISGDNFLPTRLVIMGTFSGSGLLAVFSNPTTGEHIYNFPNIRSAGDLVNLEGNSSDPTTPRYLKMKVNVLTGLVEGEIFDSRPGLPKRWSGRRIISPTDAFPINGNKCNLLDSQQLKASLGNTEGTLSLQKIQSNLYAASFSSKSSIPYVLDFHVNYLPSSGVIYLVHDSGAGSFVKITLGCKTSKWDGIGFSTTGLYFPANLEAK